MRSASLLPVCLLFFATACKKSVPDPDANPTAAPAVEEPSGLQKLASDLKSSSNERRNRAIRDAVELHDYEDVIPTVLEAMREPTVGKAGGTSLARQSSPREAAVQVLLKLGNEGKKALTEKGRPILETGLKDPKPAVREHSANAIGMAGPTLKASVDALVSACADSERDVRSAAYRALEATKAAPTVPIVKLLIHSEIPVAVDAASALTWLKPKGAEAVPHLVAALQRSGGESESANDLNTIYTAAADALAKMGKDAAGVVPQLVELLKKAEIDDVERFVRAARDSDGPAGPIRVLRRMGKPAAEAVALLLKSPRPLDRYQAAAVLSGIWDKEAQAVLPDVMTALEAERGRSNGQLYAFEELFSAAINLGGDAEKIATISAPLLEDKDEAVRSRAAYLLGRLGRKAAPAVAKLIKLLDDPEGSVQSAAVTALSNVGPAARPAIPALAKKISRDDEPMARDAIKALARFGRDAAPAVPALAGVLDANDQKLSIEAAELLAVIGPGAAEAVPAMAKRLGKADVSRDEIVAFLRALAAIGPKGAEAVPAIQKLSTDREVGVRSAALESLGRVGAGKPDARKRLVEALSDPMATCQISALKGLAALGEADKTVATEVRTFAEKTRTPLLKLWAAAALAGLGHEADANVKAVRGALQDKSPSAAGNRLAACDMGVVLGPRAADLIPDLIEAVKEKSPAGRDEPLNVRAARALGRLGPAAKKGVPELIALLKDKNGAAREAAVAALARIGPEAFLAVPPLQELARNEWRLREAIATALDQIATGKKDE